MNTIVFDLHHIFYDSSLMNNKNSSTPAEKLSPAIIFGETTISWGNKFAPTTPLREVWQSDRNYLQFAANLATKKNDYPIPSPQFDLIRIVHELETGSKERAAELYSTYQDWQRYVIKGEGLETLPRPSTAKCRELLADATILAGHADLDGIYSLAALIARGGALSSLRKGSNINSLYSRIRMLRYGLRDLKEYTMLLMEGCTKPNVDSNNLLDTERVVVIDYAAHPKATLSLDHHTTALRYWPLGESSPCGIFDTSMPSCPSLLKLHCQIDIPNEVIIGCDLVDGAQYKTIEETIDFSNPFVSLELALSVDVSEPIQRKVVLTLAQNDLDPYSVLNEPVWQARIKLLQAELAEQRSYWSKDTRYNLKHDLLAVADGKSSPYSSTRFRYLPFENTEVMKRPYLLTIRGGKPGRVNLGVARNPFYSDKTYFDDNYIDLGVMTQTLGTGGGRIEAAAVTVTSSDLQLTIESIKAAIDNSTGTGKG